MFGVTLLYFAASMLFLETTNVNAMDTMHKFALECIAEVGITEEQLEDLKEKDTIDPCFLSCMLKKAEILDSKGMLNVDNAIEFAKTLVDNDDDMDIVKQIINDCAKVNDEDVSDGDKGCERADMLLSCVNERKNALNFDL